ncbi:RNA methyltransferase [Bacillus tianshenii]|nr:RNA methyltransferase [Bacillus tianshenii]
MRSLFGMDSNGGLLESTRKIDPSRSPFIKERLDVVVKGDSLQELIDRVGRLPASEATFKVRLIQSSELGSHEKIRFQERRKIEREVGLHIPGTADLHQPDQLFGVIKMDGSWVFGPYIESEPVWLQHQWKPQSYSTALSTRVARAVGNIAVPDPTGVKAIDPCCGNGTVLVEALSMGIDIVGSDLNPLIIEGVRENIAYFGLEGEVELRDIREVTNDYDAAIIDMPYNLCSEITPTQQLEILESARRFASKLVVVTIEPIDSIIERAGFTIVDRCIVRKRRVGPFAREIIVCE